MTLAALEIERHDVPLRRPYAVATYTTAAVAMVRVRLLDDRGEQGLGAATPEPEVNGETIDACIAALRGAADTLRGQALATPADLTLVLDALFPHTPGARAAIDIALHDLWARLQGRPLVELFGRVHDALPTSITIGVTDVATTLAEAEEHLARGFRMLKVKIGADLELDLERLHRLRETIGPRVPLLVDANIGYTLPQLRQFLDATRGLDLQVIEQPLPPAASTGQRELPPADITRLLADESLHGVADVERLLAAPRAFGAFNIKLMKCGGIGPARAIASRASTAGVPLMWGCMDESAIGIAAALHTAYASPATRWLDLDGSFDLARDFTTGGFALVDGCLHTLDRPGLGAWSATG
ncbi:MAG: dipeptide epimerase [Planctomycetes bacterium]|nr:dipeptide epimerase [Planctomycetota bacterium]